MMASQTQFEAFPTDGIQPCIVTGADRPGPAVVVCEHASSAIPEQLGDLGLSARDRLSHAVWDIGAKALAERLAERLNAPLVTAGLSRLVLDLNRPPEAADSMPALVEVIRVPGNEGLSGAEKRARTEALYHAFHDILAASLDRMAAPVLVTVHSFTPVWKGRERATRIGLLHDADPGLALAMLARAGTSRGVELNAPYSAADGVTHTLAVHGTARGIPNVMIEVRNDLLGDEVAVAAIADEVMSMLLPALEAL